jgi:hypothetical protein
MHMHVHKQQLVQLKCKLSKSGSVSIKFQILGFIISLIKFVWFIEKLPTNVYKKQFRNAYILNESRFLLNQTYTNKNFFRLTQ